MEFLSEYLKIHHPDRQIIPRTAGLDSGLLKRGWTAERHTLHLSEGKPPSTLPPPNHLSFITRSRPVF